jgi:16S rRNA (adenine1518-N6/adenine1519-N6)-dimethyltransferase
MLRSSLRQLWPDPEPILQRAGIVPTLRAEDVPVAGFLKLARFRVEG